MQKKKIIPYPFECLSFYFLVHPVSVHLSAHLSFSDETMGVLLVLMGHVGWNSCEQQPLLADQEKGPAWQNRLAIGRH